MNPVASNAPSGASAEDGPGRWKLEPETARRTQGLVVSHFSHLPSAEALFLDQSGAVGGGWLKALRTLVQITDASGSRQDPSAASIAFSCSGLTLMKLPPEALTTFSVPFQEGMHQVDRQRRLSDDPARGTVVPEGARWSGNIPDPLAIEASQPTPKTVHSVLLLYAADDAALDIQVRSVTALLEAQGVHICHQRRLSLREDAQGIAREHFGFADGISQPVPTGEAILPPSGPGSAELLRWHGVKAGEILLGHENSHKELAPGPILSVDHANGAANGLSNLGAPPGYFNLGLNGSYLVIRELIQDVAGFWRSMEDAAQQLNALAPAGQPPRNAQWLAARVIGRTLDGVTLRPDPAGAHPGAPERQAITNDFGYADTDVHGMGCPLGAHVRRANPRDSLPSRDGPKPDLSVAPGLLEAANAHRILRRGRKFGPDFPDHGQDDGAERGLMFMCLNADLVRHFEFVQQSWMLNPSFATLSGETDPLLGPADDAPLRPMTIPACPVAWRPAVRTCVQMAGGEYFFLPSIPALDYLGSL